jgi:hypothetical protein
MFLDLLKPLSDVEKKKVRLAVENELERYRIFKTAGLIEENSSYYTKEKLEEIYTHCNRIERAVEELPAIERHLIQERYLTPESDYITDQQMYSQIFNPPISERTYVKYRERAMVKLAFFLDLECD